MQGVTRGRSVCRRACGALALSLFLLPLTLLALPLAGTAQEPPDPADAADGPLAPRPVVAVFPFQVFSAQPVEYLGESVSNLIRTRLSAGGQVEVLDPDAVDAALGPAAVAETRESELREIAARLGAEYVVTGSVTELAGRYSLDVRVTPAAPGLEGHSAVVTAEADEALLARVDEVADDLAEHVVGAAPARVARVQVEGAGELLGRILPELRARAGEPFDPAAVRDDLALLRGSAGVERASVETERSPEGMVVTYRVTRADVDRTAPPSARVAEVRVRGNRRIEAAAIEARIATRPGQPLRRAQVARDLRQINELGFFRNVRVFVEAGPEGQILTFEVEENPVVRQISISGNENVDGDEIKDLLTLTTGSTLDYPLLFENRERVAALYRAKGYYLAEVDYEIEDLSEASVGIHFIVEENEKLKLRTITFEGNEFFSDKDLTEGFKTKRWRFWSYATSWFDRSGTYSEPLFLQDLQGVQKKYADAGFLQATLEQPDVIPSPEGIEVIVHLTEGQRYKVGAISVEGDESVDVGSLEDQILLEEGDWFNRSALSESVELLTQHYANRGFYFAAVTPLSNLGAGDEQVDVVFQVRKGPLYFIREIDISGNTVTVDPVVRREVELVEGQLYSQRDILLSRLRIERLGYFEEVDIAMEPTEVPEQLDMAVRVVEKPTGSFSFGAGFSSQDGFVGTGSLAQNNLFGRGYAANASVDFGTQTQRFFLSLTDPYFLGSDWSMSLTGFYTDLQFDSFRQEQIGTEVVFGHALSEDKRKRGFLRYSYARRRIEDDSRLTAASLVFRDFLAGALDTSLVGLSLVSDTRDDRLAPTRGWNLGLTVDGAGLGGFARFLRTEGRAVWYMGSPRWLGNSTFVLGLRAGYVLPFNDIGDYDLPTAPDIRRDANTVRGIDEIDDDLTLPISERYFLGGLGTFQLRGFRARTVGPRRPILNQATFDGLPNQPVAGLFLPVGKVLACVDDLTGQVVPCQQAPSGPSPPPGATLGSRCADDGTTFGNGNGVCNEYDEIRDEEETDVIGGNKFMTASFEFRFPISETLGLQGLAFFDTGNAFEEGESLFQIDEWRYGTGVGLQWFSPFGPLAVVMGFPLDKLSFEDSPVFEFSVGGRDF